MVERLIDREALLMDTPFLRRIREEGRAEGRAEARAEAALAARRRSILDVLVVRARTRIPDERSSLRQV